MKGKNQGSRTSAYKASRYRTKTYTCLGSSMMVFCACFSCHFSDKTVSALAESSPGQLHLHPISETHPLRPTLTYLDALSRKSRRRFGVGSGSDSDDGPPPDPDEPAPTSASPPKQDKR